MLRHKTQVTFGGENAGNIPSYNFYNGDKSAEVTKAGCHLLSMTNGREEGEEKITAEQAVAAAADFLEQTGYKNMESAYYMTEYGVCTVNFSYNENGGICYPDMIKVGVSLSDGTVTTFDARGYITNHTERDLAAPKKAKKEARAKLARACPSKRREGRLSRPTAAMKNTAGSFTARRRTKRI